MDFKFFACFSFFHDWTNSNCQEFSSSNLKFFTPRNFKGIVGKRDKTVWKKWPRKKEGFWLGSVCTLQKWPKFAVRRTSSLICSHMENVKYRRLLLYRPPPTFTFLKPNKLILWHIEKKGMHNQKPQRIYLCNAQWELAYLKNLKIPILA